MFLTLKKFLDGPCPDHCHAGCDFEKAAKKRIIDKYDGVADLKLKTLKEATKNLRQLYQDNNANKKTSASYRFVNHRNPNLSGFDKVCKIVENGRFGMCLQCARENIIDDIVCKVRGHNSYSQ